MDNKSAVCMANYGKDIKHIRHITMRVHLVRNGEKWKIHKINWCEGSIQLAEIATRNVSEHDWTARMKYIMVRLYNWYITIVQEEWHNTW